MRDAAGVVRGVPLQLRSAPLPATSGRGEFSPSTLQPAADSVVAVVGQTVPIEHERKVAGMGITIPGELDFALDLLGYEWPNIDEDAVRDAATLIRGLEQDLKGTLDDLETTINTDLVAAFKSKAATSYIEAFVENRTQNMDQMVDLLPGVADGVAIYAEALVALKLKVIAELVITAAQIAAAIASAVFTFGASLAAQAAIIAVRKKLIDVATDLIVDELVGQILVMVLEPMTDTIVGLAEAVLAAPLTTSAGGEPPTFDVSYDLMDQLATAIDDCGAEQEEILLTFIGSVTSLPYSGA